MKMEIKYTTRFRKQYQRADKKVKVAFKETPEVFLENPNHPTLRNHLLTKEYAGIRSINVTGDWRALYREEKKCIVFVGLGTHEELYG